jgi:hypothetical protein
MSKRRKNQFREGLDAKREALTRAANQPKPEPEWEPETPSFAPRSWQTVSKNERPSSQKNRSGGVDKEE